MPETSGGWSPRSGTTRRRRRLALLEQAERTVPISFAIVGAQKAATSTLYRMFVRHPMVAGGPEKEIGQFIDDRIDWSEPDHRGYVRPADGPDVVVGGDATPAYLAHPQALARMHDYDPSLLLVASLRDPIERAASQWAKTRRLDPDFHDLRDCVDLFGFADVEDLPHPWRWTSMFARGRYGEQLQRGLELFPREQWLVLDFADVVSRPHLTLDRMSDHVGLPRFESYPELIHRNATSQENAGRAPTAEQLERLVTRYADDLALASELTGLDVSGWPTSKVAAGRMSVEDLRTRVAGKLGLTED